MVFIAVINTITKINLGEEKNFILQVRVNYEGKSRQKFRAGTNAEAMEEGYLLA